MVEPERATELLWGTRSRHGLSLERIVRTAIELADAEGLSAVSMRRVAERLGFTTMSLYRHVPGKAELVDLMRDEVLGEGADAGTDHRSSWRVELEAWARDGLALYRRHPWLAEFSAARRVPGPNAVARFEGALDAVARAGLPPAEVVAVVTLVGGFVESAARQMVETARTERRTGVSEEEWWGGRDSLFQHLDRYPTLSRIYREGGYDAPVDPFEFGLRRVLDGVEVLVRDESRDETPCAVCGKAVDAGAMGRPRDYCSSACRQRAYRTRKG
ncbi:TetR/AcrR family transcriptional regulator [Streptosporangium lutulentum]|uniref:AcrR family transcriptional regulator n=1 Tax=Streptosporangium lutulentum TaxID=1461250 RepID=A0ABT9Q9E6_9ACTN|nr:TetR/AcrR family transcriptional regulator [Streptosporangium lutulentum]MDP9842574.1 AcrR family transcriptional regulator [Streptosporangium lutulentum]